MMFPLRASRIAAVGLEKLFQMVAQRLPAVGVLPRAIRHNPVNFADDSLPDRGANEIRDRERAVTTRARAVRIRGGVFRRVSLTLVRMLYDPEKRPHADRY